MKDFKFNKFNFLRFGFFLSWIAAFVIVTSPLAMAEQSKNLNKELIVTVLKEMGVADNKDITMGEVWKRIRLKVPAELRARLDLPFQVYKDEKFPRLEISEIKNSNGEKIVALNVTDGADTARVELQGTENTFMKFNGKSISADDLVGMEGFFSKIQDEKIVKKDQQKYVDALKKQPTFPTYEMWKKMSPYERAHFIVRVRLMMREVDNVLAVHESGNKTSKSSRLEQEFDWYLKLLLGQDAEAAEAEKAKKPKGGFTTNQKIPKEGEKKPAKKSADKQVQKQNQVPSKGSQKQSTKSYSSPNRQIAVGESCIVGGYPYGRMTQKGICTLSENGKLKSTFVNGCKPRGKTPQISCNPVLYGYNRHNGGPICVDYDLNNPETQVATTANGVCEKESPLKGPQDTYDMIHSILAGKINEDDFQKQFKVSQDGKYVEVEKKAYDELMMGENGIFKKFEDEKNKAEAVCSKIEKNPSAYELPKTKQQTKACAALLERTMNLKEALATVIAVPTAPLQEEDCPPTAPIQQNVVTRTAPVQREAPVVQTREVEVTAPRQVEPRPVTVLAPVNATAPQQCCAHDTCAKRVVAGAVVTAPEQNSCADGSGPCDGEGAAVVEKEKEEKKSGGMPLWAKIGLIGLGIGALTVLGLWAAGVFDKKKKKAKYTPPVVVTTPNSLPVSSPSPTSPPPSIEGGAGSSGATGGGVR